VRVLLLIILIFCSTPVYLFAQDEKPLYLSIGYGSDRDLEKADRILSTHPTLISLTLEKRLPNSEFYGLGVHAYRFTSVFENYNHLSIRGYQHFGDIGDAKFGNFDPYIGAFVGGDNYEGKIKPAIGVFVGLRLMFTQVAGIHAEFLSVSSGFNSSILLQFGFTTCFLKNDSPKLKKWGNKCPR
jgi:hypothetical protein